MTKEAFGKLWMSAHPAGFLADLVLDLMDIVRGKVGQPAIFEIGPELLHGIEFRRIGWQPVHMPACMGDQVPSYTTVFVGSSSVPEQHKGALVVSLEVEEEGEDLRASDIFLGMEGQIQSDPATARGDDKCPDAGDLFVGSCSNTQGGGNPPQSPGPA